MGKRKTFGKVSQYDLLDWVKDCGHSVRVIEFSDSHLYGCFKFDGKNRQIRLIRDADVFEIDDGNFDRWANSVGRVERFPYTKEQFDRRLARLLA